VTRDETITPLQLENLARHLEQIAPKRFRIDRTTDSGGFVHWVLKGAGGETVFGNHMRSDPTLFGNCWAEVSERNLLVKLERGFYGSHRVQMGPLKEIGQVTCVYEGKAAMPGLAVAIALCRSAGIEHPLGECRSCGAPVAKPGNAVCDDCIEKLAQQLEEKSK
jgi:hypothetical protein